MGEHSGTEREAVRPPAPRQRPGRPGAVDVPSRSDGFVGGLSEAIGGPLGRHSARRGPARYRTAALVVLMLAALTLTLHLVQKSPCRSGAWENHVQYTRFCYTDVLALYYAEGLHEGRVPYVDHPVEYPVLTGAFMALIGLPVHAFGAERDWVNEPQLFYDLTALALVLLAIASVWGILALRRRRPWDAAMFALAPAMLVTATVNWDFLAIAFAVFGVYAWARRWPVAAGVLLGLGAAAKLWPLFLLGPLLVLGLRTRRSGAAVLAILAAAVAWLLANVPVMVANYEGWREFLDLNSRRPIDWGTFWYIGANFPVGGGEYGLAPFEWLGANIPVLNLLTYVLFGLGCLAVAFLALLAPTRPRVAQLAFLVVALFLLTSKVWSQQFVLWLIPLLVLARPRWGAFLVWQAAELAYFLAFYGQLLNISGQFVYPEWVFVLASMLRWGTVAALCVLVVRDVLHPERDPVRATYGAEDPDGGLFNLRPRGGRRSPPVSAPVAPSDGAAPVGPAGASAPAAAGR